MADALAALLSSVGIEDVASLSTLPAPLVFRILSALDAPDLVRRAATARSARRQLRWACTRPHVALRVAAHAGVCSGRAPGVTPGPSLQLNTGRAGWAPGATAGWQRCAATTCSGSRCASGAGVAASAHRHAGTPRHRTRPFAARSRSLPAQLYPGGWWEAYASRAALPPTLLQRYDRRDSWLHAGPTR